jgi:hypothetical protein
MFKKRLVVPITGGQYLGLRTEETVAEGDASMATFFFGLEVVSPLLLRFSEPMVCCRRFVDEDIPTAQDLRFFSSIPPLSGRKR